MSKPSQNPRHFFFFFKIMNWFIIETVAQLKHPLTCFQLSSSINIVVCVEYCLINDLCRTDGWIKKSSGFISWYLVLRGGEVPALIKNRCALKFIAWVLGNMHTFNYYNSYFVRLSRILASVQLIRRLVEFLDIFYFYDKIAKFMSTKTQTLILYIPLGNKISSKLTI